MSKTNIKRHVQAVRQNNGVLLTDQVELVERATAPTVDLLDGRIYYNSATEKFMGRSNSAWIDLGATSSSSGVNTWDELYANDQSLTISATYGTLTFTVSGNTAGLTLNKTASGSGGVLVIANSGSGDDITGPDFSFNGNGTLTVVELGTGATINATDGDLELSKSTSTTTIQGDLTVDEDATFTTDVVLSDGSLTITDADEAATLAIINNTAAAVNVVSITADAIAAGGSLLYLDSLAAGMSTGLFINCYDNAATVWSVGDNGATVIAGAGAANVFTITAGDILMSAGGIAVTKAANNATLTVTNDTATTASVFVFAGAGAFTGTTTTSFMTITPSGLTSGTAVYLPLAACDTGTGLQIVANAITSGQAVEITSSATTLATTGRLFLVDHSGATGTTAVIAEFTSDATDETTVLRVAATAAISAGVILDVSGAALTDGVCIDMTGLAAITAGKAIHIDADGVTQTDGILVHIDSASTALTSTGRLLLIDHTGSETVSGVIAEFASAADDETLIVKISASDVLALGAMLHFEGATVTTGDIIVAEALDALTTGIGIHIESGATAITGVGRLAYFNHTGNASTSGTLVEIASAATDETIMFQLTASSTLIAGEIIKVTAASLTTGTVLEAISLDALTTGIGVHIESGATAITGAGRLLRIDHTGATTTTAGIIAEIASAATDETIITKITASGALAAGFMLQLAGSSVTTGDIIAAESLDALTDGIGIHIESGATAITATGGLAYFNHTGATTAAGAGVLVKGLTAATDATVMLGLTASSTITGSMISITADSSVTGKGIDMSMDALTTGVMVNLHSDSADATARDLLHIHNDNTAAVATVPLTIVQDALVSTNFQKCIKIGANSIWVSDGTTPNANLAATTGDICLNGTSGQTFYCTNGAGSVWATLV